MRNTRNDITNQRKQALVNRKFDQKKTMCLFPITIENPRYKKIGTKDQALKWVTIKCGQCIECRQAKAREWRQRCEQEMLNPENTGMTARFITFTISNETAKEFGIDYEKKDQEIENETYEKENKMTKELVGRWRRKCQKRKIKQKHFFITEHGETQTERIHIHGIIWFKPEKEEEIKKTWPWGIIDIGELRETTIPYIVKYIHKFPKKHKNYKPIVMTTPGIGKNYIKKAKENQTHKWKGINTNMTYRMKDGKKTALCEYYKRKLFTIGELELYRKANNNLGKRWVRHIEYDTRNTKEYERMMKKMIQEQESQPNYLRPEFAKSKRNYTLQTKN